MSAEKIFIKQDTKDDTIDNVFNIINTGLKGGLDIFGKMADLAKTNPLWGGIAGIVAIDLLSHKYDLVNWTHEEMTYVNTDGNNIIVSIYDQLTGAHVGQTLEPITVSGILSQSATLQILVLILTAYGITEAGAILGDITSITNFVGNKTPSPNLVQPTLTTLVEAGNTPTIDISKK